VSFLTVLAVEQAYSNPVTTVTPGARSVILVRHAEAAKTEERELTPAGIKRAQELAGILRGAGISAIVITDTRRSRDTAAPLAAALKLEPQVFHLPNRNDPVKQAEHRKNVESWVKSHTRGSVLVVGHETSVPAIIRLLGGPELPDICSTVHDKLFVLTPESAGMRLSVGRYGSTTECNS
jgi:phosphohistidine phosphatase SixA